MGSDMANTSSRMLRLLSLLETHRYWPGAELAARLEVSARTLRRDIDRLRDLGYPVQAQRGVDGGYQLAAGAALPPLVLDDDEAVALALGLQAAAQAPVEGLAESSVSALAKVAQVMPPRLRRRVEALRAVTGSPAWTPSSLWSHRPRWRRTCASSPPASPVRPPRRRADTYSLISAECMIGAAGGGGSQGTYR